jgi:hypothetical protein
MSDILPCLACQAFEPANAASVSEALVMMGGKVDTSGLPMPPDITVRHLARMKERNLSWINDIHCHFFPDVLMRLVWRWFDGVGWPVAYRLDQSSRIEALRANGIRNFTTLYYAHKQDMASGLNSWSKELADEPGVVRSGTFYPEDGVLDYVQEAIESGIRLFKLHCEVSELDLNVSSLKEVFAYLEQNKIPIVIHCGTAPLPGRWTGHDHFVEFMSAYPELVVVVAHMGAAEIPDFLDTLEKRQLTNLYLDTTMVFTDFALTSGSAPELHEVEPFHERILFGTDFPNIPYGLSHPINKILDSSLSDQAVRNIMADNMARLLNLPVQGSTMPSAG